MGGGLWQGLGPQGKTVSAAPALLLCPDWPCPGGSSERLLVPLPREDWEAYGLRVQVGQLRLYDHDTLTNVTKTVRHPKFNQSLSAEGGADVALLKLEAPVTLSERIGLVPLPPASLRVPERKMCWVTGWGYSSLGGKAQGACWACGHRAARWVCGCGFADNTLFSAIWGNPPPFSCGKVCITLYKTLVSARFSGVQHIHHVVQPQHHHLQNFSSSHRKPGLHDTVTPLPRLCQPRSCFPLLCIYLFWTFHVNVNHATCGFRVFAFFHVA